MMLDEMCYDSRRRARLRGGLNEECLRLQQNPPKDAIWPPKSEPEVRVIDPSKSRGHLKVVGGSMSDDWNNLVANQTIQTLPFSDPEEIRQYSHAAVDALMGIKPRDELEGMIGAQLIGAHNAAMECYRRAMLDGQTLE